MKIEIQKVEVSVSQVFMNDFTNLLKEEFNRNVNSVSKENEVEENVGLAHNIVKFYDVLQSLGETFIQKLENYSSGSLTLEEPSEEDGSLKTPLSAEVAFDRFWTEHSPYGLEVSWEGENLLVKDLGLYILVISYLGKTFKKKVWVVPGI